MAPANTPDHEAQALALLGKAEPLPLASPQRLSLLASAQVHATLALLDATRSAACQAPAKVAAKAATRKAPAKKSETPAAPVEPQESPSA